MHPLITKLQYNNFEPGEFVDIQQRDYNETISLIQNFPWQKQRDKIIISLTNPSITIEGKNNDFLKLALYYNQKLVLYYFNSEQALFTKQFIQLEDAYPYIESYFSQPSFNYEGFKKENTWMQDNLPHFTTRDFKYLVTSKRKIQYLLSTSGINFGLTLFIGIALLITGIEWLNPAGLIILAITMLIVGGGIHSFIFLRYNNYLKGKLLIMSKGNDLFYFGSEDAPVMYNKKEITRYTTTRIRGSRNPFGDFAIVEIEFRNGTLLKIPNLLIDHAALENKLFEYPRTDTDKFPFI